MTDNIEVERISIAVASNSVQHRNYLKTAMQCLGIRIVLSEPLSTQFIRKLDDSCVDVILLDMDERTHDCAVFEDLLDRIDVPILFNDVSILSRNKPVLWKKWYGNLLLKIAELTGKTEWESLDIDKMLSVHAPGSARRSVANGNLQLATNVWVLGSSLGGPEMLKQFLSALSKDLPVAFIVAQHMGANFGVLLAEQLDRITELSVLPAVSGHVLRHQDVVIAPVNERILIGPIGAIDLNHVEFPGRYSPSIDCVIEDTAKRYGNRSGTIIFSGMGNDGTAGAQRMKQAGGQVWAQEAGSCVDSSMPDNIREIGVVDFSGTPIELVEKLMDYYA